MGWQMRLFLPLWSLAWSLCLPLILLYLWHRGRRDPRYIAHLSERFGSYRSPAPGAVWIHAVSLGELRSAIPIITGFLDRGEHLVITCFTPAGRAEAQRVFASGITAGRLQVVWVPLDLRWTYARFLRAFAPKMGLVMEVEIWPRMVFAARAASVPLLMCNAQYPAASLARDSRGLLRLRQSVMRGFAGALVKSDAQAARFASVGVQNIAVMGELRFDQPIPPTQMAAGQAARAQMGLAARPVYAFVSTIEGEDPVFIDTIQKIRRTDPDAFFVYVPRRPERFDAVADALRNVGLTLHRRSVDLPNELSLECNFSPTIGQSDILLGDSLGEMYFYLAMADCVTVGGSFSPKGAHNISEALAMGKPVFTGPSVWTIEFPFTEAEAAGVARKCPDAPALAAALLDRAAHPSTDQIMAFFASQSNADQRFFAALPDVLCGAQRR